MAASWHREVYSKVFWNFAIHRSQLSVLLHKEEAARAGLYRKMGVITGLALLALELGNEAYRR